LKSALEGLESSVPAVNSSDKSTGSQPASRTHKGRRGEIEGEEQVQVIEEFRYSHPDVGHLLIHIPNGGSRKNKFEGYRLKRQGVRAGVSDLLLPVARGGYFGLWIEFKATPPLDAPVTQSQQDWIKEMNDQGYKAEICLGITAALDVLKTYMAMPPTTSATLEVKRS
jgi:hypothetical protein